MTEQLTLFAPELHAKPSASLDSVRDLMTRVATLPSPFLPFLNSIGPVGWFGRMSPVCCRLMEDGCLEPSLEGWQNSGMGSPTGFLTLNMSEWNHTLAPSLKDEGVCSLSDILEIGDLPRRFFLSKKACAGILRRAEKRGKDLPPMLERALKEVAGGGKTSQQSQGSGWNNDVAFTLNKTDVHGVAVMKPLGVDLFNMAITGGVSATLSTMSGSEDGTGPKVLVSAHETGQGFWQEGKTAGTIRAEGENRPNRPSNVIAFKPGSSADARSIGAQEEIGCTLEGGGGGNNKQAVATQMQVRRLTPRECEWLQGFPDDYTLIPYNGKPAKDGPRYKALGNSMAVNVMSWIGQRIQMVDEIVKGQI